MQSVDGSTHKKKKLRAGTEGAAPFKETIQKARGIRGRAGGNLAAADPVIRLFKLQ
jgi:hypothetical protein